MNRHNVCKGFYYFILMYSGEIQELSLYLYQLIVSLTMNTINVVVLHIDNYTSVHLSSVLMSPNPFVLNLLLPGA